MAGSIKFKHFDPLEQTPPWHPFPSMQDIVHRARKLLSKRTQEEIYSAAEIIEVFTRVKAETTKRARLVLLNTNAINRLLSDITSELFSTFSANFIDHKSNPFDDAFRPEDALAWKFLPIYQ